MAKVVRKMSGEAVEGGGEASGAMGLGGVSSVALSDEELQLLKMAGPGPIEVVPDPAGPAHVSHVLAQWGNISEQWLMREKAATLALRLTQDMIEKGWASRTDVQTTFEETAERLHAFLVTGKFSAPW